MLVPLIPLLDLRLSEVTLLDDSAHDIASMHHKIPHKAVNSVLQRGAHVLKCIFTPYSRPQSRFCNRFLILWTWDWCKTALNNISRLQYVDHINNQPCLLATVSTH